MNFYMVSCDGDDLADEPLMAESVEAAADLYVQAILDGKSSTSRYDVKKALCIYVGQFVPPEGGSGLMDGTLATSVPTRAIPSWRAAFQPKPKEFDKEVDEGPSLG